MHVCIRIEGEKKRRTKKKEQYLKKGQENVEDSQHAILDSIENHLTHLQMQCVYTYIYIYLFI